MATELLINGVVVRMWVTCQVCGHDSDASTCPNCGQHKNNDNFRGAWRRGYYAKRGDSNLYSKSGAYAKYWQAGYDWRERQG